MPRPKYVFGALVIACCLAFAAASDPGDVAANQQPEGGRYGQPVDRDSVDFIDLARIDTSSVDDDWDPRLRPLVAFVNMVRGPIDDVVQLEIIDRNEFALPTYGEAPEPTGLEAATIDRFDDLARSFGLTNEPTVGVDDDRFIEEAFAFYNSFERRIVVLHDGPVVEAQPLSVVERVILVHELTHAMQDDNGLLLRSQRMTDSMYGFAIVEGEADRVLDDYVAQLSDIERVEWETFIATRRNGNQVDDPLTVAGVAVPYTLGQRLHYVVDLVRADDRGGDDEGTARTSGEVLGLGRGADFRSSVSLLDPFAFADDTAARDVLKPKPRKLSETDFAFDSMWIKIVPIDIFYALASAVEPEQALLAARQIRSTAIPDAFLDTDGRFCLELPVKASEQGRDLLAGAAHAWAAQLPEHRSVEPTDGGVSLAACDPGAGSVPHPVLDPLQAAYWVARFIDAEIWLTEQGVDRALAPCLVGQLDEAGIEPAFFVPTNLASFAAVDLASCGSPVGAAS